MIKTLKWVYKLGYERGMEKAVRVLEQGRDFHSSQAQIKDLQKANDKHDIYGYHKVSPSDHEQRSKALEDALNAIDPVKYPNIDNFMEMLK